MLLTVCPILLILPEALIDKARGPLVDSSVDGVTGRGDPMKCGGTEDQKGRNADEGEEECDCSAGEAGEGRMCSLRIGSATMLSA